MIYSGLMSLKFSFSPCVRSNDGGLKRFNAQPIMPLTTFTRAHEVNTVADCFGVHSSSVNRPSPWRPPVYKMNTVFRESKSA